MVIGEGSDGHRRSRRLHSEMFIQDFGGASAQLLEVCSPRLWRGSRSESEEAQARLRRLPPDYEATLDEPGAEISRERFLPRRNLAVRTCGKPVPGAGIPSRKSFVLFGNSLQSRNELRWSLRSTASGGCPRPEGLHFSRVFFCSRVFSIMGGAPAKSVMFPADCIQDPI